MSSSIVRAALVASVACTLPPVSRHNRKLSMVPKASSPPAPWRARRPRDRAARRSCWRKNTDRAAARSWRRSPARGRRAQRIAKIGRAPVLPDDRIVDRLAGGAVPDDGGLALIGDADAGDIVRGEAGLGHRLAHGRDRRLPDFLRVVLDQTRRRKDLPQFLLRGGERLEAGIERDRARRGGALIDGDESGRQAASPGLQRAQSSSRAEFSSPRPDWRLPDRRRSFGWWRPACAAPGRNSRRSSPAGGAWPAPPPGGPAAPSTTPA